MFFLFAFTMVYVWQHLASIEVGYKVEAQKQQVEQMRETNRQLRLNEAQLSDPQRIDKIAKQLGLAIHRRRARWFGLMVSRGRCNGAHSCTTCLRR